MRTIFSNICMVALGATMLTFTSCQKDEEAKGKEEGSAKTEYVDDGGIYISPSSVMTRTDYEGMMTTFSDGDEVGVYAVARKENEASALLEKGNYANNVRYKYVTSSNSFVPVDKKETIYRNPVGVLDIYVYYPYNSNIVDATAIPHYVFGNQTTKANFCKGDMMVAECIGYKEGLAALQFKKMMACLEVIVNKRMENGVEGITLKACNNGSVVNMVTGEVETINNAQPFRMYLFSETDTEYHFRSHLPAQTVAEGTHFVDVALKDGKVKQYNNASALSLAKGALTKYDITLQSRIKVLAGNGGTVSVTNPDKTGNVYNDGTSIEATAQAIPGWLFKGWEEDRATIGTDNPYTFVSETNRTITAIFERGFFKIGGDLTYTNGTHPRLGGNGCSVTPVRSYVFETKAQLTATPGNGFSFSGWTDGNSNAQRWEIAGPTDMVYMAKFSRNSYSVTGSASPSNGGMVSGGGNVLFGDPASLSASASSGYHFSGWSNGSSSSTITIDEVNGSANYIAYFEADPVTPPDPTPDPGPDPEPPIDPEPPKPPVGTETYCIICDITGSGTVSGTGCGKPNGTYTLTATPSPGWSASWTTRQVTINGGNENTSVTFTKNPETVTWEYTFSVSGDTKLLYREGGPVYYTVTSYKEKYLNGAATGIRENVGYTSSFTALKGGFTHDESGSRIIAANWINPTESGRFASLSFTQNESGKTGKFSAQQTSQNAP